MMSKGVNEVMVNRLWLHGLSRFAPWHFVKIEMGQHHISQFSCGQTSYNILACAKVATIPTCFGACG